jgi:integrase
MLQFILLTATRLREASNMERTEIAAGGTEWTIPAARHKSKRDFLCPLSQAAQDLLAELPVNGLKRWVFTTDGNTPISGFSKWKANFDELVLADLREADPKAKLERWTTHDLRRTARSLMSRAGCLPDHAERALGHVVGGVRGVYDRHEFKVEKTSVFEALAHEIESIVNPQTNVVSLRKPHVSR